MAGKGVTMGGDDEAPWDLYREIHKAMRLALFGVTTMAGAADAADATSVQRVCDEWRDVRLVLIGHHHHEDAYCDPLITRHAPSLRDTLEAEHDVADASIDRIDALVHALPGIDAGGRVGALQGLHLELADFTAQYLQHLRFEEREVMPALNVAMNNADLAAVTDQIRLSVPPPEMCVFIRYMVPSMNFVERADMLGGMHAGAPPEIFELFRAAAEGCLPADEYRAVAMHCGFA
jgi:hypothetical protein